MFHSQRKVFPAEGERTFGGADKTVLMCFQIVHDIAHGLQTGYVTVVDGDAGGLFQSHDQLHGSQGISAQVVGQVGLQRHLLGVAAQGLHNDVPYFLEFHMRFSLFVEI